MFVLVQLQLFMHDAELPKLYSTTQADMAGCVMRQQQTVRSFPFLSVPNNPADADISVFLYSFVP
jgi:hypothetical protein